MKNGFEELNRHSSVFSDTFSEEKTIVNSNFFLLNLVFLDDKILRKGKCHGQMTDSGLLVLKYTKSKRILMKLKKSLLK